MTNNFSISYSNTDGGREINVETPSGEPGNVGQHTFQKQIYADEENKSRLSMDSTDVKRWSSRNKKNIAICLLTLLVVILLALNLDQMKNLRKSMGAPSTGGYSGSGATKPIQDLPTFNGTMKGEVHFLVKCQDSCTDIDIMLGSDSGNANLYANSDGPPAIANFHCSTCDLCNSSNSNGHNECRSINAWPSKQIYIAVLAQTNYTNAKLRVRGNNLQDVTKYDPKFTIITKQMAGREIGKVDYFKVTCQESCKNVIMNVESGIGDIDLYAEEDQFPYIFGSYCPGCTGFCKAERYGSDMCESINTDGNEFYVAVATKETHTSASLRVKGINLKNVTTASAPQYKTINKTIESGLKGGSDNYFVICTGKCKTIYVTLSMASGDADLYGHHDRIPEIMNRNCYHRSKCTLCKSRKAGTKIDFCAINEVTGDDNFDTQQKFFLSVHGYKDYTNATLSVKGENIYEVEHIGTLQPSTTTTVPTTTTTAMPTTTSTTTASTSSSTTTTGSNGSSQPSTETNNS